MRSLSASIILLLTFNAAANSQSFFIKLFSDSSNVGISDLLMTADSNLLLVGSTIESGGGLNLGCSLTCVDTLGNFMFTKRYFRSGLIQSPAVQVTNDGYLLSGVDEQIHGLLLKTNSSGNQEFAVSYGDSANWTVSTSTSVLPSGNILSFGYNRDFTDDNNFDVVVAKYDKTGNFLEGKTLDLNHHDVIAKAAMVNSNEFIICGETASSVQANDQAFILKIDSNANVLSCHKYVDTLASLIAVDFAQTSDANNFLLLNGWDAIIDERFTALLKTDSDGNPAWIYRFSTNEDFRGTHLRDLSGSLILTGILSSDTNYNSITHGLIVNLDYSGNLIWSKKLVLNDGNTIGGVAAIGHSLFIAGSVTFDPQQRSNYFLAKSTLGENLGCEEELYSDFTLQQYDVTDSAIQVLVHDFGESENTVWQQASSGSWSDYCSSNSVFNPGSDDNIHIFPNPCSDFINVNGGKNDLSIECFDCLGRIAIQSTLNRQLDVRRLPDGLYYLFIDNNQTKQRIIYKFIKTR